LRFPEAQGLFKGSAAGGEFMAKPGSGDFFRNNGLSLAYLAIFLFCLMAQSQAGWRTYNKDQEEHQEKPVTYQEYLGEAHFWQAVGENWESEFLQMGCYVLFTVFLFQRGSAESKDPDKEEEVDHERDPRHIPKDAPGPVRAGGFKYKIYRNSLSLAFLALFLLSFALHLFTGASKHNQEELAHGRPAGTTMAYLGSSDFWFESMQNWQSEFLAVFTMVFLSIYLRQKGSPESKPVYASHQETPG
jgi:hypothetical protein